MKKEFPEASISLTLSDYNDIFSDFDPRPYDVRGLSDDLLNELKHANRAKPSGEVEIRFIIPKEVRKKQDEPLIVRRLQDHFKKHYLQTVNEVKSVKQKGYWFIAIGAIITLLGAFVAFLNEGQFLLYVLVTLLEPAGWFTIWNGFDFVVLGWQTKEPELKFYERMSHAEISFVEY